MAWERPIDDFEHRYNSARQQINGESCGACVMLSYHRRLVTALLSSVLRSNLKSGFGTHKNCTYSKEMWQCLWKTRNHFWNWQKLFSFPLIWKLKTILLNKEYFFAVLPLSGWLHIQFTPLNKLTVSYLWRKDLNFSFFWGRKMPWLRVRSPIVVSMVYYISPLQYSLDTCEQKSSTCSFAFFVLLRSRLISWLTRDPNNLKGLKRK